MKRIINAVTIYVAFCVLGTLLGAVFCMLCMNVTNLVVGTRLSPFSASLFVKGLFLSLPLSSVVALLLVLLHQIRHNSRSLPLFLVYVALHALTWLLVVPQALRLSLAYDMRPGVAKSVVSPGYFREDGGLVYYWAKLGEDGTGDGLRIDPYGIYGTAGAVEPLRHAALPQRQEQSVFADALIGSALKTPRVVESPLAIYLYLLYQARDAASRAYGAWLAFASLGLSMLAIYALGWLSSWRLLNAFVVMVAGVCVVFLNYALYASALLAPLGRLWEQKLGAMADALPLAAGANVVIMLLFALSAPVARLCKKQAGGAL